jgi:hypothetical protein
MPVPCPIMAGWVCRDDQLLLLGVAVAIMMIRWWVKFGSLTSEGSDWARAKRTVDGYKNLVDFPAPRFSCSLLTARFAA